MNWSSLLLVEIPLVFTDNAILPLWLKLAYTAFLLVLVPVYWIDYGPSNFLYFCDIALFATFFALWFESPVLASAAAVGIVLPQTLWMVDYLGGWVGYHPIGTTEYMFDTDIPLFTRGLSLFHFWLPILLVYLVAKLGYDWRGLLLWTGIAVVLLPTCYFFFPPPEADVKVRNINFVFGLQEKERQTMMPPLQWLGLMMVGLPLLIYIPSHFLFRKMMPTAGVVETENDPLSEFASETSDDETELESIVSAE